MSSIASPERPQRRAKKLAFKPPKRSLFVVRMCELVLPHVLSRGYDIASVEYRPDELERFRGLLEQRVLITPNHPTHAEPAIAFDLGKRGGKPFYYLSNREAFGFAGGLFGLLLQRCGAYSVMRGLPDRECFKMTRKLLAGEGNQVVIFPEGEVYSQNDTLLPFQGGVFQLALLALEDMQKAGSGGHLFVQPMAIHYRFVEDMAVKVEVAMSRLEATLGIAGTAPDDPYPRLRRIGHAVLCVAERTYKLPKGEPDDLNPRIDAIRNKIVERVAEALNLSESALGTTMPDKMRTLMNRLSGIGQDEPVPDSFYQEKLLAEEQERVQPLIKDLKRLSNWIAVKDDYVAAFPSQERMIDTIWRLESEVLGYRVTTGRRKCFVRLPAAIDLRQYQQTSSEERRAAVKSLTSRVESTVQGLLDEEAMRP